MGQKQSKRATKKDDEKEAAVIPAPARRKPQESREYRPSTILSVNGLDSYKNIDAILSNMGIAKGVKECSDESGEFLPFQM